jgi:hypothetical protein
VPTNDGIAVVRAAIFTSLMHSKQVTRATTARACLDWSGDRSSMATA